jgi:hypothetical protein
VLEECSLCADSGTTVDAFDVRKITRPQRMYCCAKAGGGGGGGKPRMDELSHESGDLADWSGYSSFDSTVHYRKSYGMITNNIFCLPFWPGKSRCSIRAGWDWLAKLCGGQNIKELGWPSICLLPWITFKTFGGPMDFWIGVPPAGGNLWYVDTSK